MHQARVGTREDYGFVANVHDEWEVEVREELAGEYSAFAEECIAQAGRDLNVACPHIGEAATGTNWYQVH